MNLYHYTVVNKLPLILDSGYLALTPKRPIEGESPLLWFSSNPVWEETANKGAYTTNGALIQLTKEETAHYCGGLARFKLNSHLFPQILPWAEVKNILVPPDLSKSLEFTAELYNSVPAQWFVSKSPISIKTLDLELYINNQWVTMNVN